MPSFASLDLSGPPLLTALAAIGLIATLGAAALVLALVLRAARRVLNDDFAGLYGTYYGYRAALKPDPSLPLPLGVQLDIVRSPWRRRPRGIWQNPALDAHGYVTGTAYRNSEGFAVVLDEKANLPFIITLLDLTRLGIPDIKVGIQSGHLQAHKHPYAAPLLFSRRPLDQRAAAQALGRFAAIGVTPEEARAVAEQALAGTPPAMTVLASALVRNPPSEATPAVGPPKP